jgi:hypothetical protein
MNKFETLQREIRKITNEATHRNRSDHFALSDSLMIILSNLSDLQIYTDDHCTEKINNLKKYINDLMDVTNCLERDLPLSMIKQ